MRIISDTHDYYDCLQRYDEDRTTLYIRKEEEEHYKHNDGRQRDNPFYTVVTESPRYRWVYGVSEFGIGFEPFTVGFCGKIYRSLKVNKLTSCYIGEDLPKAICWDTESVVKFIKSNFTKNKKKFDAKKEEETRSNLDHYFEVTAVSNAALAKVQEQKRAPVMVAHRWHSVFNTPLKPFEFYRVLSPAPAYMQLIVWFCNQAPPMKPIPKLSDEVMAHTKGYDKHSFRKEKLKHR